MSKLILAFDAIKDPRDLAEIIHLAAGAGAEVHTIGDSISPRHWKVLRKLRSWRPRLAGEPDEIHVTHSASIAAWIGACRQQGCRIVGTVVHGGSRPWSATEPTRLAVLFGEESHGLQAADRELCDELWTLPLGDGGSFYTLGQATALILGGWIRPGPRS